MPPCSPPVPGTKGLRLHCYPLLRHTSATPSKQVIQQRSQHAPALWNVTHAAALAARQAPRAPPPTSYSSGHANACRHRTRGGWIFKRREPPGGTVGGSQFKPDRGVQKGRTRPAGAAAAAAGAQQALLLADASRGARIGLSVYHKGECRYETCRAGSAGGACAGAIALARPPPPLGVACGKGAACALAGASRRGRHAAHFLRPTVCAFSSNTSLSACASINTWG